jgi:hypothetical protein
MEVVVQKAVREANPSVHLDSLVEAEEKAAPVCVIAHDCLASVALCHDVMNRSGSFLARLSRHRVSMAASLAPA